MSAMLDVRRNAGPGEVALAWFADKQDGVEIINHSGGTGGYMSFIGYDRRTRLGVVVLSNTGVGSRITDIGMHLLNPRVPLLDEKELKPPKRRSEIPVDPNVLETYAGRYRFPSGRFATITSEDGHLCLQGEGDVKIAFYPESKTEFFAKFMDAQIIFKTENGVVTELDYVQNGNSSRESVRRIR
jgi:hypothetical protein